VALVSAKRFEKAFLGMKMLILELYRSILGSNEGSPRTL
jgi:hypothetical protein